MVPPSHYASRGSKTGWSERAASLAWSPFNTEAGTEYSSSEAYNTIFYFDPNDKRYRCCCQQSHSTTGVRIIAGMLCLTVVLEIWHLAWFWLGSGNGAHVDSDTVLSSTFQLLIGIAIAGTVLHALHKESAVFLIPYLLLQTVGLGAVFVILFALVYITLMNDRDTIKAFVESHGPKMIDSVHSDKYLSYVGWTMVGSCLVLLALQLWLISIVFACWRYFRDKHNYGYAKGHTSSFVILRPSSKQLLKEQHQLTAAFRPILRSMSADELRPKIAAAVRHQRIRSTLSSFSYELPTRFSII
ncbi:hypothetical protein DdX_11332 [Ditylenchus destructor]|uniref:Uncharacterized protein n=1 Tax=Ditylenchus destructor TaxID=166010 RepID=A0AAD4MZD3_9BILA|nr:hypothetical protein DdX_11332 [Ditylenchus destructor]